MGEDAPVPPPPEPSPMKGEGPFTPNQLLMGEGTGSQWRRKPVAHTSNDP
jgi:hypothetical protein